ncbi:hypothetical protein [Saccharothrix sp. NRRL B-16314]|uniref:hypothetical protein n=1 Tax=Saccharothrix sp. NRRL B-16314 TaxID=1463825 RepID=UPI000524577F|nr:hypothetical protein [Saccharothrix sp. NRRL B-16314]
MNTTYEDRLLRHHLAAVLVGVLYNTDRKSLQMARAETHRLVGAVTTCLGTHPLDMAGQCSVCRSSECALRSDLRLALLPFDGITEDNILDVAGIERAAR